MSELGGGLPGRLLVVSDSLTGGLGVAVASHSAWFVDHGWSVEVAAPPAEDGARVAVPRPVPMPVTVRDVGGVFRAARSVRRIRAAFRPDVVHCHGARSFLVARLSGWSAPFVTIHGINPVSTDPPGYRLLRRPGLVAMSVVARRAFAVYPDPPAGWRFLPHASSRLRNLEALPGPDSPEPSFLWVGSFDEPKRPDLFIEAIASVAARRPGVLGLMAGSGTRRPWVEGLIARTGAPVRLLGQVADIDSLLRQAWGVVLLSNAEGVPFALEEAMWAARAVVASRLAGTEWLAGTNNEGASLVDTAAQAADALLSLCDLTQARRAGKSNAEQIRQLLRPDDPWPAVASAYRATSP